jgi:methylthioribulose-1-phosphate dehydratase
MGEFKRALIDIGALFYDRGWSVGTSSNYSVRLRENPLRVLITASGKDKRRLGESDFVQVDEDGRAVGDGEPVPSAETLLHIAALRRPGIGAVLHCHSVWSTILSDYYHRRGSVDLSGFEMLKGLEGIKTHETSVKIPIFENTQEIAALARQISGLLQDPADPLRYGFLLRGHGLYTWGKDVAGARRHVEILEFLFEALVRRVSLPPL